MVTVTGLSKRFGAHGPMAVHAFDLSVGAGEILCLLGPSGCGKTTLLRLIAGFERPEGGTVEVAGRVVAGPGVWVQPERRRIGFVFQDFALFPHLNVLDNVAFGIGGAGRTGRRAKAAEILALVGLTVFQARFPHQLSGGQQQRVALARALATGPHILLLDEPFSNLDASLRGVTRDEVRAILKQTGTTAIMVTHDQEEALCFADRIAVMRDGQLEQAGTPEVVYFAPKTAFVASFLGRTNLLRGVAEGMVADTSLGSVPLAGPASGRVVLSLRPEHLSFGPTVNGQPTAGAARVQVVRREFKGHDVTFECRLLSAADGGSQAGGHNERILVNTGPDCPISEGQIATVLVNGTAVALQASAGQD